MNPHRPSWLWTMWYRLRPSPDFVVPPKFNRNSHKISSLMPSEDSGAWLLERMRRQIGLKMLASSRVLDFGCGVRFTQAILNKKIPIGSYTGVDCFSPMIDFLRSRVRDRRFSFVFLDARHALYNPNGRSLSRETQLPLPLQAFDIVSLFSVITHQYPDDTASIFTILRRHTTTRGRLFFTFLLDDGIAEFEDRSPERNGGMCFYNPDFLARLVEGCGWRIVERMPADPPLIAHSFLCAPA